MRKNYILISVLTFASGLFAYSIIYSVYERPFIVTLTMSLIILLVSLWLMQQSINIFNIRYITIPAFFYLFYIMMIFIPSFFVYFNHPGPNRNTYLIAVDSVLLTIPIGIICANVLFKFNIREIKKFFHLPLEYNYYDGSFTIAFLVFLYMTVVVVIFYIYQVKSIPLFYMITHPGHYEDITRLREESFKLLGLKIKYLYSWLRALIFPFLIMLSYGVYLETRTLKWLIIFLVTITFGTMYVGFSTAKGPVANIFVMLFVFYHVYRCGKISGKNIATFLFFILWFPFLAIYLSSYSYGQSGREIGITLAIFNRIWYAPAEVLYYYFEVFPNVVGPLYGRSIGRLAWLMGVEYFDTNNYVGRYAYPWAPETINANAAFIGDMNADFGILGVLLGGILAGFIMQFLSIYMLRKKKNILVMTQYSFLTFVFSKLCSTSLTFILLSGGVIIVLFMPQIFHIIQLGGVRRHG